MGLPAMTYPAHATAAAATAAWSASTAYTDPTFSASLHSTTVLEAAAQVSLFLKKCSALLENSRHYIIHI